MIEVVRLQSAKAGCGWPGECFSTQPGFLFPKELHVSYIRYSPSQSLNCPCQTEFRKYNIGMRAKVGRPARDPKAGPSKIVPIRMTDAEKAEYQRAAKRAKLSLSEWIRDRLGKAAKRESRAR